MASPIPQNEDFYRALLNNSIVSVTDSKGIITYVSDGFCTLTGYSRDELVGNNHDMLNADTQTPEFYDFIKETITSGNIWKGELNNLSKQGRHYWVDTTIIPIAKPQSSPHEYITIYNNITQQKDLIETLKKRAHRQGLIAILGQLASNSGSIQGLLDQTIAVVTGSMDMNLGIVAEFSVDGGNTLVRASSGLQQLMEKKTLVPALPDNIIGFTSKHDGPVIIENIHTEDRFSIPDFILDQKVNTGVSMLIGDRAYPFGLLMLFSESTQVINLDETYFLQSICNMISESVIRHNMETALRKEKELSRKYLDIAEVMIIAIDKSRNIVLANQKASKILGYDQNTLLGMNWFDNFIPAEIRDEITKLFHNIISGIIPEEEISRPYINEIVTKNKSKRLIKWNNRLVYDEVGNIVSILSAGEDITEFDRAEKEQKKLQRELIQAQKMEAIGMLTGGIAHDFNNILASILGFSTLAIERFAGLDEKLSEYLHEIEKSGTRAKEIIAQMQNLNQPDPGKLEPTTLPSLVKNILKMLRSAIPTSIEFEQHLDTEVPPVQVNPTNINQVIMNLLINARDSMQGKGHLTISISSKRDLNTSCSSCQEHISGDYVLLSITDTGSGIKTEDLSRIFDSAYTTKEEGNDSGSGLANVHRIVHESGGHILVESEAGKGTSFHLLFNVARQQSAETAPVSLKSGSEEINTDAHIMIVDDENSVASFMGELFNQVGYEVTVYTDSTEALRSFKEQPDKFDLMITDQTMPSITGDALAQEVLRIKPDLPVILCTGYSDVIDETKARELNIKGFLKKPIETPALLACVYNLLNKQGGDCL